MIRNEVDDFRAAFFDQMVQVEQERERVVRRKQLNCFHKYVVSVGAQESIVGPVVLQCVLCQHTIVRRRK